MVTKNKYIFINNAVNLEIADTYLLGNSRICGNNYVGICVGSQIMW